MSDAVPSLTAALAARAVMRDRWARNLVVSNFTPADWFECDVAEITAAGFLREYEVKLSRATSPAMRSRGSRGVWSSAAKRVVHIT